MKKLFLSIIGFSILSIYSIGNAADFTYYYGQSCSYCFEVAKFFEKNDIESKFSIEKKEVYFNSSYREEFLDVWKQFWVPLEKVGVPFMVNNKENTYMNGAQEIVDYFQDKLEDIEWIILEDIECSTDGTDSCNEFLENTSDFISPKNEEDSFFKFLLILFPAALSDSINPCAFAVLFILLSSILSKFQSYRKAIISGLLFSLAIFISYFLMWVWVYKVLAFSNQIFYVKLFVWILWILVWLANIKDYFWYGKVFVMEVPFSWRPKMKKILQKVVSPSWALVAWFIVSLFLLPCTSWPYLTVLGYLAAESSSLNLMWYIYMFIYNLIFVLPMIAITLIVWFWVKDIAELKEYKEIHRDNIHLVVWILMLWLGLFIMWELFLQ